MAPTPLFNRASRAHETGHWAEAEKLYKQVLAADPGHADALHMLGYLAYQNGRNDIAIDLTNRAIGRDPRRVSYHNTLGGALLAAGRAEEAVTVYRRAFEMAPGSIEIANNLGNGLQVLGRLAEAGQIYRAVLAAAPTNGDVLYNLGYNSLLQGDTDAAIDFLRKAAAAKPDDALIQNTIGGALHRLGRFDEAVAAYARATVLAPDNAALHKNLAVTYHLARRWPEAGASYARALTLEPGNAATHDSLGYTLHVQGRFEEAVASYEHALAIDPANAHFHNNLGFALEHLGRSEAAEHEYRAALALKPDYPEARNNLGNLRKEAGDFGGALDHYRRAIADDPFYTQSYLNRAELTTTVAGDPGIEELTRLAQVIEARDPRLPPTKALYIHFALAKALIDIGDHAGAFAQLEKGNALKRSGIAYDREAMSAYMRSIAEVFSGKMLAPLSSTTTAAPIFIVGMPRSGTTLIEQILATHPDVQAVGEVTAFDTAARTALGATSMPLDYATHAGKLAGAAAAIALGYLDRLPPLAAGKTRTADKLPGNFLNIGLIHLAFPNARIVHAVRDPVDTCVSCYSKLFREGQDFTYDLTDLGRYARDYQRLMAHWGEVLPQDAILDVAYENVVADLEGEARRLLVYCGLTWDPKVLEFHRTERPIATASALQVRQPIYTSALKRGEPYEAFLGPLREALGSG